MSTNRMAFVRQSKFRHVFGEKKKKEQCYDGIRISKISWETTFSAVNPKFLAIQTDSAGGSAFLVIPLSKTGRVPPENPQVSGHKSAVMDLAWCPHNDNVIASASDDCTVKIWEIPDEGLTESLLEPICTLEHHQKRVTSVFWHPTAKNVLLSVGSDNKICIWHYGEVVELLNEIDVPDQIYCVSFNYDGSEFVTTCKDKKLRVYCTSTGDKLAEKDGHKGTKPPQCAFLKDGRIFTTGFSRMAERQYALWDSKLENILCEEIDNSNGINFIFYDPDTSIVYLVGKGDCQIRYYEVNHVHPYVHWLTNYTSNTPQRGIAYMPKRGCNVNNNEIARFYKLHNNGYCEVLPFIVPRKSDLFQDDLYPDTASDEPSMSIEDFRAGKFREPKLVSLKGGYTSTKKETVKVVRKSAIIDKTAETPSKAQSNNAEAAAATPALPPTQHNNVASANGVDVKELIDEVKALKEKVTAQDKHHDDEVKALKDKVTAQEKRIDELEKKLASMEVQEEMLDDDDNEEIA